MRLLVVSRDCHLTDALKVCEFTSTLHAVTFITMKASELALPTSMAFAVRAIPQRGGLLGRAFRWFAFCRRQMSAPNDVVYMYYFPGCSLLRFVFWRNVFVLDIRTAAVTTGLFNRYLRDQLLRLEASCFHHVAIIGEGLRRRLRLCGRGVQIVPVGGDLMDLPPKQFDSLKLLYIGSTARRRRLEDTILGFARLYRELGEKVNLHYTIVGDSADGNLRCLRQLVVDERLNDVIDLPGYIPHDQLDVYLDESNVGISYIPKTPFFEHQPPTKTFEYLLAGMPVIATATAENARIINPTNGLLIADSSDSVYRGLRDLLLRRTEFESARIQQSVIKYSWANIVRDSVLPLVAKASQDALPPGMKEKAAAVSDAQS
jgi:glycosyltransferase involved in cell wall biosynthesis